MSLHGAARLRLVRAAAILVALIAMLSASCSSGAPSGAMPPCQSNDPAACTVIDGYPVGRLTRDCGPDGAACEETAELALLALDKREPNHPVPTAVQEFEPDLARICGPALCAFSSIQTIVVFTFADGARKATGHQCPGVNPCVGTLRWNDYTDVVSRPSG